jgi:metallo-beta-lactamase family protein
VEIEFSGAAREVTGSCHILRANGKTILLDCGMFQGRRNESKAKNMRLPIPTNQIDAVVLSHAHIDHAGRLPFLVKEGYNKTIFATPATRDLSAYMLADSAHIQEKDALFLAKREKDFVEPLYTLRHAVRAIELMVGMPYHKTFEVVPGVSCTYVDAGHILGSASVILDIDENVIEHGARRSGLIRKTRRLVFSADIGRAGLPIIRDPEVPDGADWVICESTYGNRDHESVEGARAHLARVVRETAARGGKIIIPAFAVGRTQEIIYELHILTRENAIPALPIFIDSPLAIDATGVFQSHPDVFDHTEDLIRKVTELFHFGLVRYTREAEESKKLNTMPGPAIIIAASGMAESGRVQHHLLHNASDSRSTILVVGFMAEHTLGRRIVERQPVLKIYGEEVRLRAQVEIINGYSAHADRREIKSWLDRLRDKSANDGPSRVFLVHGEPEAQDELQTTLRADKYTVDCPEPGAKFVL